MIEGGLPLYTLYVSLALTAETGTQSEHDLQAARQDVEDYIDVVAATANLDGLSSGVASIYVEPMNVIEQAFAGTARYADIDADLFPSSLIATSDMCSEGGAPSTDGSAQSSAPTSEEPLPWATTLSASTCQTFTDGQQSYVDWMNAMGATRTYAITDSVRSIDDVQSKWAEQLIQALPSNRRFVADAYFDVEGQFRAAAARGDAVFHADFHLYDQGRNILNRACGVEDSGLTVRVG